MKSGIILVVLTGWFTSCGTVDNDSNQFKTINVEYPQTAKDSLIEDYHGTKIADPYRWLEDDHAPATEAWVNEENKVTQQYLEQIPYRKQVEKRLSELWNYERYTTPFRRGGKLYFFRNSGLQNQNVLYVQHTIDDDPEIVLDPNKFSADGTIALSSISFDKQGSLLAYIVAEAGSDWTTIKVLDLNTGKNLDDEINWVKFSTVSWHKDGFYYSRFPAKTREDKMAGANNYHKIYYHQIGTPQSADVLVIEDQTNPTRLFFAGTTEDEKFLAVSEMESSNGNALYVKDLTKDTEFVTITDSINYHVELIGNHENLLFIKTTEGAPNGKLITMDLSRNNEIQQVLAEKKDVLVSVSMIGGKLFAEYLIDAKSVVKVYDLKGNNEEELVLPSLGKVGVIQGRMNDEQAFYSFTGFTYPTTIFALDVASLNSTVFKQPVLDFDSEAYDTKQVFYTSKDGTRVPMFITFKKGLELSGKNPTLLYGYGGFNVNVTPSFSVSTMILLENGGIYAVANLRGGGEYGKEWHQAGTKDRKQNVFDDFIAAAEYLIEEKYTNPDKLAIMGGSNGGLLVGACMTQRPELFQVAIPRVGVLDMLRYHDFTIGWAWADDYGRSDDPEAFKYLIKYSPLHNIEKTAYPATLVMTADHDDRVVPAHSFKFGATLQEHQEGENPILIRIEKSAGHGAGKPTTKLIKESADMMSFMLYHLNETVRYKNIDS